MLLLSEVFNKDEVKFSDSQITYSLYKFGYITKEEKDYLDEADQL